MRKLITLGLVVATVAFAGTAFAGDGILKDRELQKLFEWSAQAADAAKAANQTTQTAGAGLQQANPVPPYQEYPGFVEIN